MKSLSTLLMASLLGATALTAPAFADDDSAISVFLEAVDDDRDEGRSVRNASARSSGDRDDRQESWDSDDDDHDDDDDDHDDDDDDDDDDSDDDDGDDD